VLHDFWVNRDDLTPLSDGLSPEGIMGFSRLIREFGSEEEWEDYIHSTDLWVRSALTGSVQTGRIPPSQLRVVEGAPTRLVLNQVDSDDLETETDLPSDLDDIDVVWESPQIQELWDEAYPKALRAVKDEYWESVMMTDDDNPLEHVREAIKRAVESVNYYLDYPDSISVEIEEF